MPIILATLASSKSRTAPAPFLTNTSDWQSVVDSPKGALITYINRQTVVVQETLAELTDLIAGAPPGDPPLEFDAWRYHAWSSPGGEYQGFVGHYPGAVYGDVIALAGLVVDDQGTITGRRPAGVLASQWVMGADSWSIDGLQLAPFDDGYTLQVLADGKSVVAVPNPPPGYSVEAHGVTDHDMSAVPNVWVKVTADSEAFTSQIPSGATGTYAIRYHERSIQGGTMDVAGGIDGAAPAGLPDDTFTIGPGAQAYKTGFIPIVSTINIGQTIALWARVQNAHVNTDIWVEGSIQDTIIKLTT